MQYDLIIFDADGTLAERDSGEVLPGVREYFQRLHALTPAERPHIAIATNQGGVGMRHWMESQNWGEPAKFPTLEHIETHYPQLLDGLLGAIPYRLYAAYAYQDRRGRWGPVPPQHAENPRWQQGWRKPQAGMLLQAMADAGVAPERTLMVGDSEDDKAAAERATIDFQWAADFFGRP